MLRIPHNVTESYRYYYKTVTNLEKGFMRTYNVSMSRLYNEVQQRLNEVMTFIVQKKQFIEIKDIEIKTVFIIDK